MLDNDFDVAADVDELVATIVGGLRSSGITTSAYNGALSMIDDLLAHDRSDVDGTQIDQLRRLRDAVVAIDNQ